MPRLAAGARRPHLLAVYRRRKTTPEGSAPRRRCRPSSRGPAAAGEQQEAGLPAAGAVPASWARRARAQVVGGMQRPP
eukprot:9781303-Lingulodinium_polyedra.AAC.1